MADAARRNAKPKHDYRVFELQARMRYCPQCKSLARYRAQEKRCRVCGARFPKLTKEYTDMVERMVKEAADGKAVGIEGSAAVS